MLLGTFQQYKDSEPGHNKELQNLLFLTFPCVEQPKELHLFYLLSKVYSQPLFTTEVIVIM